MTQQELTTLRALLQTHGGTEVRRAVESEEQAQRYADCSRLAPALPALAGPQGWAQLKGWLLDGNAPGHVPAVLERCLADLKADNQAAFLVAVLVLFKTSLRVYPTIQ